MTRKTEMENPTKILSEFVAITTYDDLPEKIREQAKIYILDSIACSIGGSAVTPGKIVLETFQGMNGPPESTILSTGKKVACINASYVNSYLANLLDFDDTFSAVGHPGNSVIPPALAVGEFIHATGKELINAVVLGYESAIRIGLAIAPSRARFRKAWGMSTHQIFGPAAAACSLMHMKAERVAMAFGMAGYSAPVPFMRKTGLKIGERPRSMIKSNFGWSSMGGVLSALLVSRGMMANPTILDGDEGFWVMAGSDQCDFSIITSSLGEKFYITDVAFKPYACCRWTHTTIDALRDLSATEEIESSRIKSVTVKTFGEVVNDFAVYKPQNIVDAQFSLPFLVALELCGYRLDRGLPEDTLKDESVLGMARKVTLELDEGAEKLFAKEKRMPSTVAIEMEDGRVFASKADIPKGDPLRKLTKHEIQAKFRNLVQPLLGNDKTEHLIRNVEQLEELGDITNLFEWT